MRFLIILLFLFNSYSQTVQIAVSEDTYILSPKFITIIQSAYQEIGVEAKYTILPSKRALKEFEAGKYHALAARTAKITQLSPRAILIEPAIIDQFKIGLISKLEENQNQINYAKDYFIKIRGTYLADVFIEKYNIKNVMEAKTYEKAVEMLRRNRARWFISSEIAFDGSSNRQDLKIMINDEFTSPIHHIISNDIIQYKPQLEKVIANFKLNNKFSIQNLINSN